MNTPSLGILRSRAAEVFSSILLFSPNFPPEAQTSTEKKFDQLIALVEQALERIRRDEAKQFLRICLQEIESSRKHYEDGDDQQGRYQIQRAEQHFRDAFLKKPKNTRFIAGESGAALDHQSGFPQ
jgi:hypothetical protein